MMGWLDWDTETAPRRRIWAPEPAIPFDCETRSPGDCAWRSWSTFGGGAAMSDALICTTELPTSRRRAAPAVPVTTISSRPRASSSSV